MNKKNFLLIIILFFKLQIIFSQNNNLALLREKLLNKIEETRLTKQNEVDFKNKFDSLILLNKKLENSRWWEAKSKLIKANYAIFKSDLEVAEKYLEIAKNEFILLKDTIQIAKSYFSSAKLADKSGQIQNSMDYYLRAIKILEISNKKITILASSYYGLGTLFGRIDDLDKSIFYKKKAYNLSKFISPEEALLNFTGLSIAYGFRYDKFKRKADLDSSYVIANNGYIIAKKQKYLIAEGKLLDILISHDIVNKNFKKAELLSDEGIKIGRLVDPSIEITGIYHKVDALIGQKKFKEAEKFSNSLVEKSKSIKNAFYDYYYRNAIEQRFRLFKESGKYYNSLINLEEYLALNDSLLLKERTKALNELETKYETEKKQKAIELLTVKNQVNEAKINQKNYLIFAITIGVLSLIASFLFWNWQRTLKDRQQSAEMKQRLLRAQLNPHFLFNSLNSIQRLYIEGKTTLANDFIADFAQLMRDILEKTGRTKIPLYEEMDFIKSYLSLEKRRLGDRFDYEIVMDEEVRNSDFELPSFIVQPLVENALLHGILPKSQKGKIEVLVEKNKEENVSISVIDNGVGFYFGNKDKSHISRGMELIKNRLGKTGNMIIEELKNLEAEIVGTKVTLDLKA